MQMQDCVGMGTQEEVVGLWVVVVVFMVVVGVQVWRRSQYSYLLRNEKLQRLGGRSGGEKVLRCTYVDFCRVCGRWRGRSRWRPLRLATFEIAVSTWAVAGAVPADIVTPL